MTWATTACEGKERQPDNHAHGSLAPRPAIGRMCWGFFRSFEGACIDTFGDAVRKSGVAVGLMIRISVPFELTRGGAPCVYASHSRACSR